MREYLSTHSGATREEILAYFKEIGIAETGKGQFSKDLKTIGAVNTSPAGAPGHYELDSNIIEGPWDP